MISRFQSYIKATAAALLTAACTLTSACISDSDDCPAPVTPVTPPDNSNLSIRFTVVTRHDTRTRAADTDGDIVGAPAENYIDLDDITFLMFDRNRLFLQSFSTGAKVIADNSYYTSYTVNATITETYFSESNTENIEFYIMALANGRTLGMPFPWVQRGITSIDDICSPKGSPAFSIKPDPFLLIDIKPPATTNNQYFPMSGLQRFTVTKTQLAASTKENPVDLSVTDNLNMLRAVAKIEIVDQINITGGYDADRDGKKPERIDKIEINGIYHNGTMLPSIGNWNRNSTIQTQQVLTPTIPAGAPYYNPTPYSQNADELQPNTTDRIIEFEYDQYATSLRTDKCPVYSCYVYEYDKSLLSAGMQVPYLRVTLKGDAGHKSPIMPMRLASYTNGIAVADVETLLRNHIYTYEIVSVSEDTPTPQAATVKWTVCSMDTCKITIPPFN